MGKAKTNLAATITTSEEICPRNGTELRSEEKICERKGLLRR